MQLHVYKSLWGMNGPIEEQFERIAMAGYVGVEAGMNRPVNEWRQLLDRHRLKYIAMMFTGGKTVEEQLASFRELLAKAQDYEPVKIVVHSGLDRFTADEAMRFYEGCVAEESKQNIVVGHETHRGRYFFTPWTTAEILKKFPTLKLCVDFSHWCCVCESLLEANEADVQLACTRAVHIHGRVGHGEGPQVSDPAAPEFAKQVERHEQWWDAVYQYHRQSGAANVTFDPEFGPPTYQQTLPYTQQPVSDLWHICQWMADRAKKRFAEKYS